MSEIEEVKEEILPELKEGVIEEVKVVNDKVLTFGLITIAAVIAVFCLIMIAAFFIIAQKYVNKSELVLEQSGTILTLQRALDRAEGKLTVYDTYLTNRNIDIVRNLINAFLKAKMRKSRTATIREFEVFLGTGCRLCPEYKGLGDGP